MLTGYLNSNSCCRHQESDYLNNNLSYYETIYEFLRMIDISVGIIYSERGVTGLAAFAAWDRHETLARVVRSMAGQAIPKGKAPLYLTRAFRSP